MFDRLDKPGQQPGSAPPTLSRAPLDGSTPPIWEQGLGSGSEYELKINPEIEAMMMAMCKMGGLDPKTCADMALRREKQRSKLGITPSQPWVNPTVPDVRLPNLRDPNTIRKAIEASYKPVREWFTKN